MTDAGRSAPGTATPGLVTCPECSGMGRPSEIDQEGEDA